MKKLLPPVACVALVLGAVAIFRNDVADEEQSPAVATERTLQVAPRIIEAAAPDDPVIDTDAGLATEPSYAAIEYKYRFLLADLQIDAASLAQLKADLQQRESIGTEPEARMQLTQIDEDIRSLLPATDFTAYLALRDSDAEQQRLADYMGGIDNVAPLSEQQERAVLQAKLRQKQRHEVFLRDAGLDRDSLSVADRDFAHTAVAEGLKKYRDDFMAEVAASLTPEQYTLLNSYETTEFTRELERVQRQINSK